MKNIDMYWASNTDWFDFDDDLIPVIRKDAPIEAKNSYFNYMKAKGYDIVKTS